MVKGTRSDFFKVYEARQFVSLSLKTNVHSAWIAQSGRKNVEDKKSFNSSSTLISIAPL